MPTFAQSEDREEIVTTMRINRCKGRSLVGLFAVLGGGTAFGILPSCETVLTTVNPCGTVFAFCDPYEIEQLFADIPDFEADPTCVIPFFGFDPDHAGDANGCASTPVFGDFNVDPPK